MKKWLVVFIVALLVIVSAVIFFIVRDNNLNALEKEEFSANLIFFRCLTLCPSEQGSYGRIFDISCMNECRSYSPKSFNLREGSSIYKRNKQFESDFTVCLNNFKEGSDSSYSACFDNVFFKYNDIINLSNFTLPQYTKYNLSIIDLKCNKGSADVTFRIDSGDDRINNLIIGFWGADGSEVIASSSTVPTIGEIKSLNFVYPVGINNVSKLSIIMNTSKGFSQDITKEC